MRLRNYTDLPSDWLRAVIRAVCPPGVSGFDVRVSNGRAARGRAYSQGHSLHDRAVPFIVIAVPNAKQWKRLRWPARKAYLPMTLGSRAEAAVMLLAHELRHLWQGKGSGKRRGMVWGARGKFSERDADAYALGMLRRFRRGELGAV